MILSVNYLYDYQDIKRAIVERLIYITESIGEYKCDPYYTLSNCNFKDKYITLRYLILGSSRHEDEWKSIQIQTLLLYSDTYLQNFIQERKGIKDKERAEKLKEVERQKQERYNKYIELKKEFENVS
jgi:hypothetical protein